jgi:hypothetical protein
MDWVRIVATADSADATILIDGIAGYENDHHFRGSELWFRNDQGTAANRGAIVRVLESSMANTSFALGIGLATAPLIGDEAWLYNIGGSGTRIRTYDATINDTINSLGVAGHPIYSAELVDVWDENLTWVSVPDEFSVVSTVDYTGYDDNWIRVPSHGWELDVVNKIIALAPEYASEAHGYAVRINGRTPGSPLTNDTDETDIDYEWLTQETAATILLQQRDQFKANKGGMLKNNADAIRGKAAPFNLMEGSIRIR